MVDAEKGRGVDAEKGRGVDAERGRGEDASTRGSRGHALICESAEHERAHAG